MNYWLEWILNWHGASLGQGDSSCANKVPVVLNGPAPGEDSLL